MQTKVKEMREKAGLTQKQLAEALGTTQQSVYYYESGDRDIKASILIEMSRILNCTVSELLGLGTADVVLAKSDKIESENVPLYGSIAAGTPIEMIEVDDTFPIPTRVHAEHPSAFLLRVKGESMNRILPNGCYALIDPCRTVEENGAPYAVCVNGYDATIKRIHKLNNGFELVPDSTDPTYEKKTYNYNEPGTETITVIGRVVYYVLPFDWSF